MGARALEFVILTAARSGEVRMATWDEIDFDTRLWTVPARRIKAGKAHRVPLTDDAIRLLKSLPRMTGTELVFVGTGNRPLSDMTISKVIKTMHAANVDSGGAGYLDPRLGKVATPHGMRSCFKDWARSCTAYPDEVSELALAHVNSDATRAAYARDELLPQRTRLMRDWGRFLNNPTPAGAVVPMRGAN